jgi:hypothetical protein
LLDDFCILAAYATFRRIPVALDFMFSQKAIDVCEELGIDYDYLVAKLELHPPKAITWIF